MHSNVNGHAQLVHGDIKPGNILMDHNMQPKIADFGLAREIDADQSKGGTYVYLSILPPQPPHFEPLWEI